MVLGRKNICLDRCAVDQISDLNDAELNSHANKKATASQLEKSAALAKAAELLLRESRDASKDMAIEVLNVL